MTSNRSTDVRKETTIVRTRFIIAAAVAAAVSAAGATAPVPLSKEEKRARIAATGWKPGGTDFIPAETLTMYPCHSSELPCGDLPPPPVEKVTFIGPLTGDPKRGEAIAINVRYGNCIACHHLPGYQGGTIGPSLADYGKRNAPLEYTYQRIWDVRAFNPDAFMPLYGTNAVLDSQEIQDVIAFLQKGK